VGTLGGTLRGVRALTHDVAAVDVELDRPCDFDAGQFMAVGAPGVRGLRGYSMVNYERGAKRLEFVVKKKPGGGFSEWLSSGGAAGARLELVGPLGKATFAPELGKNILCIAGGSGIAGMMSILERAAEAKYFERHKVWVFFGVRTMKDVFFLDQLSKTKAQVTIALSEEDPPANTKLRFERGLVHEVAKRAMAGKYQNVRAYLAGPPPAVDAAIRVLLLEAKLTADNIRYDKFS
jgi:toluene monooxygenase electron transfer component